MLLPFAGLMVVGLPGIVLSAYFSSLCRVSWLHGGAAGVLKSWAIFNAVAVGGIGILLSLVVETGFGLLYNAIVSGSIVAIASGIPSTTIAVVVCCLSGVIARFDNDNEGNAAGIILVGVSAGLLSGVAVIPVCLHIMNLFWQR